MELFDQAFQYIQANAHAAPYLIFGLLLLAGLNLPVSEDIMLLTSALLATKNPELIEELFIGVYLGAYGSDLICYGLGRKLGPKLWNIKLFAKMVSPKQVEKVSMFYKKYGVLTLILGRFIPFGVRNALFLTAGLGKMPFKKFALSDWLACTISCSLFFWLYYTFGESVIGLVKQFNMVIASAAGVFVIVMVIKKVRKRPTIDTVP